MALATPHLPGIRFETVRPPTLPALPRMDIAAFAGFAAAGPVGLPVPIQDVVRFEEVFGGDLPLAWDAGRGRHANAHLPGAVREFFRNGGRRCWVLRLARDPETARFRLPGVLRARAGEVVGGAWAVASSPGSWADRVWVNATLLRDGLGSEAVTIEPGPPESRAVRLPTADAWNVLRVELDDGVLGFFPPRSEAVAGDSTAAERAAGALRRVADSCWFSPALPDALPKRNDATLHVLEGGTLRPLSVHRWRTGEVARFVVPAEELGDVRPGTWLRLDLPVHPSSRFRPEVYLIVDEVERREPRSTLIARRGWRGLVRDPAWSRAESEGFRSDLVSIELWSRREGEGSARVADVGLAPGHPRWFGSFPGDDALYAPAGRHSGGSDLPGEGLPASAGAIGQGPTPALWAELSSPRFPLAAPPGMAAGDTLIPLGLEALPRESYEQPALTSGRSALERNGLERIDRALFLDRALGELPTNQIMETAFQLRYGDGPTRRLEGIHGLLPVEEASILAVPDAVQRGWIRREGSERTPAAPPRQPTLHPLESREGGAAVEADWSDRDGAMAYELEWGPDPRFRGPTRRATVEESRARIALTDDCTDRLFVRVRVHSRAGASGWSRTRLWAGPTHAFDRCGPPPLEAPAFRRPREVRGELRLRWSADGGRHTVQRASDPSFSDAEVIYEGPLQQITIRMPTETTYFRVATATAEEESPWSITRIWLRPLDARWEVIPPGESAAAAAGVDPEARLLDLHTAALRLCAARSDAVTVLSLPPDHREADAVAHAARLRARLGAGAGEVGDAGARVLSFGALYHPWAVVPGRDPDAPLRPTPPEGSICGLLAARSLEAGAWAVPANRPLAGVVALEPRLGSGARSAFFERRVNGLVPYPDGFVVWSEETLSTDPELVGLGVRRLLILLRRIVLREGNRYLFEPNSGAFRRLVQRQFDGILSGLFARGAFAGRSPEEGYRVIAGEAVNPPRSVDQGRFIVELRVAPSRPLHFLTVRLVQTGAGLTVSEG